MEVTDVLRLSFLLEGGQDDILATESIHVRVAPAGKEEHNMESRYRIAVLVAITVATVAYTALLAPIAQDPTYHDFADDRVFLGISNFLDVASNLPFLLVGLWGLFVVFNSRTTFVANIERWPYTIFFLGVALTSVGSSYYHLDPDNTRLVWDRLPMTLGFMGILSAVLAERVNRKASVALLPSLVSAGIASVIYWYVTETAGNGDLRPYSLVQFGSLLIVVVSFLLFHSTYTQQRWFVIALSAYVTAKLLETFDEKVYGALRFVSGHTLKHLAAAAAACCIVQMLRQRSITHAGSTSCESVRPMAVRL
jgi:hypothetical protein